ncbi:(5-formylfuran-3-yl)methyl phosphate synthase [Methyloceanibacter sp.]|uniref:(5-formylfuran-3-yl)methyl phosphate synthase n=1 Tax=Methyloceanibacter sp. TaxID=1965321 RepID=UPI003D6C7CA6
MTLFLASVRDEAEAATALLARADIVDLKEPGQGALGALDRETACSIVSLVGGRVAVSATIGDLPMHPQIIGNAVLEKAACGVDYVKFGLFPGGDARRCLDALRPVARRVRLILVLFADQLPGFDAVSAATDMGAAGIMLDTADKQAGSLLAHLNVSEIGRFVGHAKAHGLMAGLAGSLTAADVPELLPLAPDLLGFRGALCLGRRSASLDLAACATIRTLIPENRSAAESKLPARMSETPAQALC